MPPAPRSCGCAADSNGRRSPMSRSRTKPISIRPSATGSTARPMRSITRHHDDRPRSLRRGAQSERGRQQPRFHPGLALLRTGQPLCRPAADQQQLDHVQAVFWRRICRHAVDFGRIRHGIRRRSRSRDLRRPSIRYPQQPARRRRRSFEDRLKLTSAFGADRRRAAGGFDAGAQRHQCRRHVSGRTAVHQDPGSRCPTARPIPTSRSTT